MWGWGLGRAVAAPPHRPEARVLPGVAVALDEAVQPSPPLWRRALGLTTRVMLIVDVGRRKTPGAVEVVDAGGAAVVLRDGERERDEKRGENRLFPGRAHQFTRPILCSTSTTCCLHNTAIAIARRRHD